MTRIFKASAIAIATASMALFSTPSMAVDFDHRGAASTEQTWQHGRDRGRHEGWNRGRGHRDNYYGNARYDGHRYDGRRYEGQRYNERTYRGTRVWQDRDGRHYCQRKDGTTGLIVGGALGALLGREIDGGRDRTLGTIIGAAGGALLGKEVAQGDGCR